MATLTLRTEDSGVCPSFEYVELRKRRAVQSEEDRPQRRHRQINERHVRVFHLVWTDADCGQWRYLETLFDASLCVLPMDYTPLNMTDDDAVEVWFLEGTLVREQQSPVSWTIEADFEEDM